MDYFFAGLSILFCITLLIGVISIFKPLKQYKIETRKEAVKQVFGSVLALVVSLGLFTFFADDDDSDTSVASEQTEQERSLAVKQEEAGERQQVEQKAAREAASKEWRNRVEQAVRKEPKVVEAMFPRDSNVSYWLSLRDDGSRRDGYAEYICTVLKENDMPSKAFTVIHVWDAYSLAQEEFKEIGRAECTKE